MGSEAVAMMSPETLAALLDDEIERALDRLRAARRTMKEDIEALEAELDRRSRRRREQRR
jgi:hypothetical protein